MQTLHLNIKHKDYYGLKLLLSMSILLFILAYASFYLIQNYFSKSFLAYDTISKKVYFLNSTTLKNMHNANGMNYDAYQDRIKYFKKLCQENGYTAQDIYSEELASIDKNSKLIALDAIYLSNIEINQINNFVAGGGKLLFNYTSGFLNSSREYQEENLVYKITNFSLSKEVNSIKYDQNTSAYLSTRLASPLTKYLPQGEALSLTLYDPLPIFNIQTDTKVDGYLTNWTQINYIKINKTKELSSKESSLIWHGHKDNGKWVYFSFPSYVFMENNLLAYANLFKGMLEYLDSPITIVPYPYIDAKNGVFLSLDTEHKYENIKQFYDVVLKHDFPVTAFCVAGLALENKELMKEIRRDDIFEISSHSYTHKAIVNESNEVYEKEILGSKKVLEELSKSKIVGFRSPREDMDDKIIKLLENGGYKYMLGEAENKLSPHFKKDILIIPKHATDDYSFLVNLDLSSDQILQEMKKQVNVVTNLDGLYTFSLHTHLMSLGSNIKIVDDFIEYIKTQKQMTPLNGKMIYDRVLLKSNISSSSSIAEKKVVFTISNNNVKEVQNLHYELFVEPNMSIKNVQSEIIGLKTELIKESPTKYILVIESIKPKSQIVLFLNYDKNS